MHNNSVITLCFLGFALFTLFDLNTTDAQPNVVSTTTSNASCDATTRYSYGRVVSTSSCTNITVTTNKSSSVTPGPPPPNPADPPPKFTPGPPPPSPNRADPPAPMTLSPPPSPNHVEPPIVGFAPPGKPVPFPPKGKKKQPRSKSPKEKGKWLVQIFVVVFALMLGLGLILFYFLLGKQKKNEQHVLGLDVSFGDEFDNELGTRKFSYDELSKATKNFADEEKLGEGGFGAVYKGVLRDSNTEVAIKRILKMTKQGIKGYASEVKIISRLRHKNLVKLIGWCHEKELLLAYEFMPNGSLDVHLFKERSLLSWEDRYKIVQGIASALLYLHEEGEDCVLHRDVKASNILLDSDFNAKLGDFGLARLVDHEKGSRITPAGTIGYIAPECLRTYMATKESDVYSFGVVALEIACCRKSIDPRYDQSLVEWVWEAYGNQMLLDVVDKQLSTNFNEKEMECLLLTGLWCVHPSPSTRPSIRQAIQVLNFEVALPNLPSKIPDPNYDAIPYTSITGISAPGSISITVPR